MKKSYLIVITLMALVVGVVYFSTEQTKPKRTKLVSLSSQEILQQEKQRKLDRRKNGYAKKDKPDKFVTYLKSRTTRGGKSDYKENYKIAELKSAFAHKAKLKSATASLPWVQRGPGNVGGRTRAIIVDPDDASGKTWFAGAVSGGIWKTTDAGQTWEIISPDLPNLAIVSLAMAPSNTNVIYAGTGEGYYNVDAVRGQGIFKSTDKGVTWNQVEFTATHSLFHYINSIVVSPTNEDIVWASTNKIVMKTEDGGTNWKNITPAQGDLGRYQKLILHPTNENILWVTLNGVGIFKTENGGDDWFLVNDMSGVGRIELTISESNPDVLYALDSESKFYFSQDGGYEWAEGKRVESGTAFLSGQGWYNNTLAINPTDDNKGFIGGVDLFSFTLEEEVSELGKIAYSIAQNVSEFMDFKNFEGNYLKGGVKMFSAYSNLYENVEIQFGSGLVQKAHLLNFKEGTDTALVISEDIEKFEYTGYVEVPFKVVNTSTGEQLHASFLDYNKNNKFDLYENGYEVIILHDEVYDDSNQSVNISSSGGNYRVLATVFPTLPEGGTWDEGSITSSSITISPYQLKNRDLSSVQLTFWDTDISATDYSHADHHNITIIDNVGDPFTVIVGNDGGIGYSTDGGTKWERRVSGYVTSQFYGISRHPNEYIYFGGLQDNGSQLSGSNPEMLSSWTEVLGGDGFDVVWHAREPQKMIGCLYYNRLYKSDDGGASWYKIYDLIEDNEGTNAPFITKIASSKLDPELLFVGGESGLWKSTNFGTSWKNIDMGDDWGYGDYASPKIVVSEANSNVVWAGNYMNDDVQYSQGRIHVSTDGGESFAAVENAMDLGSISNIVTHPNDSKTAYALFSFAYYPKIFRTTDLGATWEDISGFGVNGSESSSNGFPNVAVNTLLVMPFNDQEIWVGTEIGLFISYDNGDNWEFADNGIPAVSIWDMKIVGDEIVVGTHGLGVWSVKRDELDNINRIPYLVDVATNPHGDISIRSLLDVSYDSIEIYNGELFQLTKYDVESGERIDTVFSEMLGSSDVITMVGYVEGVSYTSNTKTISTIDLLDPVINYFNNFSEQFDDFVGEGFSISKGILNSNAIQTPHPHEANKDFYYTFRRPIIVSNDADMAFIDYKDIAFIETGNTGTSYPDSEFFDYVVVEGSKNGVNWIPLQDGYDFSYATEWADEERTYKSNPSSSLYVRHTINLLDSFASGDTILLRFKLHSDPLETGWGWAIDNLYIQEEPSGIFEAKDMAFELKLYPIPAKNNVNLVIDDPFVGDIDVAIFDISGKMRFKRTYFKDAGHFVQSIQFENINSGNYLLSVTMNGNKSTQILIVD